MNKIRTTLIVIFLSASVLTYVNANAANGCNNLTTSNAGQLNNASIKPAQCSNPNNQTDPLGVLNLSNKFPDVTYLNVNNTNPGFVGVCYVSNGPINNILWGNKVLTIQQTVSAWTDSSDTFGLPYLFGGQGQIGTVATQWTVSDSQGNNLGKIYTRDTINIITGHEDDIIIAGTNVFADAKGTIKLSSVPNGANINIYAISGEVCIPNQK
jgi:hypothetical protein